MSHVYTKLVEELSHIDRIFESYANTHPGKKVKVVYERYGDYPEIPDSSFLSVDEAEGYVTYLKEHRPLMEDIQDTQEFEILTVLIGETKMDIFSNSPEGKLRFG